MKKRPRFQIPFDNKWLWGILASVVIIPTLTVVWNKVNWVWGAETEVKTLKESYIQQTAINDSLKEIVVEQKAKNDQQDLEIEKQREISQLQIDSLKELVSQLKKR